ncbi:MAG: hypothetical protein RI894_998, partial [Bacteroidota bacterium]
AISYFQNRVTRFETLDMKPHRADIIANSLFDQFLRRLFACTALRKKPIRCPQQRKGDANDKKKRLFQ